MKLYMYKFFFGFVNKYVLLFSYMLSNELYLKFSGMELPYCINSIDVYETQLLSHKTVWAIALFYSWGLID